MQNKIDAIATAPLVPDGGLPVVMTSALTGQGIDQLRSKILRLAGGDGGSQQESGFLTNVRQQKLVQDSIAALDAAAPFRGRRRTRCSCSTSTTRCAHSTKSPARPPRTTS